jgi:hypothetical protein
MEQRLNLDYPAMELANHTVNLFTLSGEPLFPLTTPMNSGNCWLNARSVTGGLLKISIKGFQNACSLSPCVA